MHKSRGKGRRNTGYKAYNLYSFYLKGVKPIKDITGKKTRGEYKLKGVSQHNQILGDINDSIMNLIIKDNFEFQMPYSQGKKRIVKKKRVYKLDENGELITKFLPINWLETNKLWERDEESRLKKTLVYHTNLHSEGYGCRFKWTKKEARTNNICMIAFDATRTHSRNLGKHILTSNGSLNYFE